MKRIGFVFSFLCVIVMGCLVMAEENDFSKEKYAQVLRNHVDEKGLVDYRTLKKNRKDLDDFLVAVEKLEVTVYQRWTDERKISLWIDVYNALTLKVILDHYPIKSSFLKSLKYPKNSIRQISGVWDKITFPVMGEEMTLDHIEHEILRPEFQEPRIHMALVCAAMSCPPLRQEPYEGEMLREQLDDQTRRFVSGRKGLLIDKEDNRVYLSSIFKWYGEDFIGIYEPKSGYPGLNQKERAVLSFISQYLPDEDRKYLKDGFYKVKYLDYDWTLNERKN
jgi:hypothetical protein